MSRQNTKEGTNLEALPPIRKHRPVLYFLSRLLQVRVSQGFQAKDDQSPQTQEGKLLPLPREAQGDLDVQDGQFHLGPSRCSLFQVLGSLSFPDDVLTSQEMLTRRKYN